MTTDPTVTETQRLGLLDPLVEAQWDIMTAMRGPDFNPGLNLKHVLTARIRYLFLGPTRVSQVAVHSGITWREGPVSEGRAQGLLQELARLADREEANVRHYLGHCRRAAKVLGDANLATLAERIDDHYDWLKHGRGLTNGTPLTTAEIMHLAGGDA